MARDSRAHVVVAEARGLAEEGRYPQAYAKAAEVEGTPAADTALASLWPIVSDRLSVQSEPSGAEVWLQPFVVGSAGRLADSVLVGVTPVADLRIPRVDHRVVLQRSGYQRAERMASSAAERTLTVGQGGLAPVAISLEVDLPPPGQVPEEMVPVPGGEYTLVSPDAPAGLTATIAAYAIDRYEATNAEYREFVRAGGYADSAHWSEGFVFDGEELAREEAMRLLVDQTGLPGPRTWVSQDFPSGTDRHPVSGVTWYEAAAFCAYVEKTLPTVYQWEKAARDGATAVVGILMPWGLLAAGAPMAGRANFSGTGSVPVDAHAFGISAFGAYGMAGNVKEWVLNLADEGYLTLGGSWADPPYVYAAIGQAEGFHSSPEVGFRCARALTEAEADAGTEQLSLYGRSPEYAVVDSATFASFLAHYEYDKRPANARLVETVETPDWQRVKLWIDGVDDDAVLLYLYLPTRAALPFQTMVLVPASNLFYGDRASENAEWLLAPNIKAGRAVVAPVWAGMTEREREPGFRRPSPGSVAFRDLMVLDATELRLVLDYLESRPDIDTTRLAYVGQSWGSVSRLPLAAVDDRFAAVVLIAGGVREGLQRVLPEASAITFAPYIRPPKLLLNGRQDENQAWLTRALPLWNLMREPKTLVLVEGAGHIAPVEVRAPAINEWLDETLGPVQARPATGNRD
jgi:formylglycine-generating enzyme required for sulfatase activity